MGYSSTPVWRDLALMASHDTLATPARDVVYLELRLQNGTSVFVPVGDTCIPTD